MAVAPLLPAVRGAGAYDASDPMRELVASTPFAKLSIALLRTGLAVGAALPMMVLMSAVVPELSGQRRAWLFAVPHAHRCRAHPADRGPPR